MVTHGLKILPPYFRAVSAGLKTFEIRKNDRDFHVDDLVELREWTEHGGYTGKSICFRISYVAHGGNYGLAEGYCVLGLVHPATFIPGGRS